MRRVLGFVVSFAVSTAALSPVAHAIQNGQSAVGDPRVVAISSYQHSLQAGCSGALVAPRIVITAGHCTLRMGANGPQGAYQGGDPFSGEFKDPIDWFVYAPGEVVPVGGNSNRSRVLAQFLPAEYKDGGAGRGPRCDFAVLVLETALSSNEYAILSVEDVELARQSESAVEFLGYGLKSWQDNLDSMSPKGRNPNPSLTAATLRATPLTDGAEKLEVCEGSTHSNLILHADLPDATYIGGNDSGGPLWIRQGDKWVFVGPISGSVGLNAQTSPDSTMWKEEFWLKNSGGSFYVAANFKPTHIRALEFLNARIAKESAAQKQAVPVAVVAPQKVVSRPMTIKCVKGKQTKKVTAVSPKCPRGFRRA